MWFWVLIRHPDCWLMSMALSSLSRGLGQLEDNHIRLLWISCNSLQTFVPCSGSLKPQAVLRWLVISNLWMKKQEALRCELSNPNDSSALCKSVACLQHKNNNNYLIWIIETLATLMYIISFSSPNRHRKSCSFPHIKDKTIDAGKGTARRFTTTWQSRKQRAKPS